MQRKWVDNEVYFGPDRRKGGPGKRWGDRRSYDDAAEAPPIGMIMRRLRVQLTDVATPEQRRRVYELAKFAAAEAERQHLTECADHLRRTLAAVAEGNFVVADAALVEAQTVFNEPR